MFSTAVEFRISRGNFAQKMSQGGNIRQFLKQQQQLLLHCNLKRRQKVASVVEMEATSDPRPLISDPRLIHVIYKSQTVQTITEYALKNLNRTKQEHRKKDKSCPLANKKIVRKKINLKKLSGAKFKHNHIINKHKMEKEHKKRTHRN